MAYGGLMGQKPESGPPSSGLPTNDVRQLVVKDGENINAGDVVDVGVDGVYKNLIGQDNTSEYFSRDSRYAIPMLQLSNKYTLLGAQGFNDTVVSVLDNNTGKQISSANIKVGSYNAGYLKFCKVSDNIAIAITLNWSDRNSNKLQMSYITVDNSGKISINTFSSDLGSGFTCSEVFHVIYLDNNKIALFLADTDIGDTQGTWIKIFSFTTTNVTEIKSQRLDEKFGVMKFSDAIRISDLNGNKRIAFYCNQEYDYPICCIYTISSADEVTQVAERINAFNSSDNHTYYHPKLLTRDNKLIISFNGSVNNFGVYVQIATLQDNTIGQFSTPLLMPSSTGNINECSSVSVLFNNYVATIYTDINKNYGIISLLNIEDNSLSVKTTYTYFNGGRVTYLGAANLQNQLLVAFRKYGSDTEIYLTKLEEGNGQIAGSFTNTSKTAIALQSGTSGQTIPVGFGGYCACDGVTAGQTINSAGVIAYAPLDGWLDIRPEYNNKIPNSNFIFGTYTGNGAATRTIDVGFTPSAVYISAQNGMTAYYDSGYNISYGGLFFKDSPLKDSSTVVSEIVNNGFTVTYNSGSSGRDARKTNVNNTNYYYIAFR